MEILFFTLIILAFWHFLWEGVLAPGFRQHARYRLFTLRDELRSLYMDKRIPKNIYHAMQRLLNNAIDRPSKIDLLALYSASKDLQDPEIRAEVESEVKKLHDAIQDAGCEELVKIRTKSHRYFGILLLVNCGSWLFYVIPLLLLVSAFSWVSVVVRDVLYMKPARVEHYYSPYYRLAGT